jgi:DNA-directed RNA polymerase subunit L
MNKVDINVVELSKQDNSGLKQSSLKLDIYGGSINSSFINSLRRIVLLYIPTYAFCKASIEITENTSVLNNDYMRLRLEQFTYPNLKNNIVFLPEKYWKNVSYSNIKRDRHPDDKTNIEYIINVTNNQKNTINVTTEDMVIYEDGEKIQGKFSKEFPMLVVQLKEGQSFKCRARCVLGLGIANDIWAGASNVFFDELEEGKYKFTIESQGQMDEYELLKKACIIMMDKMEKLKNYFKEMFKNVNLKNTNEVTIELDNEDIMIGSILNETFQMNKHVQFSGLSRPYSFTDKIFIKIVTDDNDPMPNIFESIDYIILCYKTLDVKLTALGKKYIRYDYV